MRGHDFMQVPAPERHVKLGGRRMPRRNARFVLIVPAGEDGPVAGSPVRLGCHSPYPQARPHYP